MGYTCTIHTECVNASITDDVLENMTRIVREALLTEENEEVN